MKIEPIPGTDTYRLCEDEVYFYKGKKYTIRKGKISDGASIPRFGWLFSTTPYHPTVIRGAFAHDDHYEKQTISKKLADKIAHYLWLEDGTEKQVAKNMYDSVRDFGGPAWRRCKKKLKKAEDSKKSTGGKKDKKA